MNTKASPSPFARIPKVDKLLGEPSILALSPPASRPSLIEAVRASLEDLRRDLAHGVANDQDFEPSALAVRVQAHLAAAARPYYRRVVNATGVILHTGIGRAVLPKEAVTALAELSVGSQRLEIDLETGDRGGRDEGCAALLRRITGCEAATVVNNNAAATILILAALTHGRKAIVSRGELVEIGGSFRIPEVMEQSGAILAEVGATNRTNLADYRRALDAETGMLLKVHTSNYRIVGFTGEVEIEELAALGREVGVPVVHDLGSGCVVDLAQKGLRGESLVQRSLAAGADLVCFSGGKAIRGPQSTGILCGRSELIASAALQMLDMDDHHELWDPPADFIDKSQLDGIPRHGIGRTLKVSKEEIAALLTALDLFASGAYDADVSRFRALLESIVVGLAGAPAQCTIFDKGDGESPPWLEIAIDEVALGRSAFEVCRRLRNGTPPVYVSHGKLRQGVLVVYPLCLTVERAGVLSRRMHEELH